MRTHKYKRPIDWNTGTDKDKDKAMRTKGARGQGQGQGQGRLTHAKAIRYYKSFATTPFAYQQNPYIQ